MVSASTREFAATRFGYHHALLLFRSEIEGRGGMLPRTHMVACFTTAADETGEVLLCTDEGVQFQFPISYLHPLTEKLHGELQDLAQVLSIPSISQCLRYVGGQTLTWDQHLVEVPAQVKFLTCAELSALIKDHDALRRGGHHRL